MLANLTVVDLFAGCGGMSLGFKKAGYQVIGGVERDPKTAETYARNVIETDDPGVLRSHAQDRDISKFLPVDFRREFLGGDHESSVDVIVAGPPCQAFARIGRAKLREIMNHERAYLRDERADLYTHFLFYVEGFRPKAVILENVPEILNFGGKNVAEEICLSLRDLGYRPAYTMLNAAHFGVPQSRVRFFLLAYREDLEIEPSFPSPSHRSPTAHNMYRFPVNGGQDKGQFPLLQDGHPLVFDHYVGPIEPDEKLPESTTTEQAIGDLPPIFTDRVDPNKVRRNFEDLQRYRDEVQPSQYARMMRNWNEDREVGGVKDHVIRYLPRDHEIFRRMQHGDQYPRAYLIAMKIFVEQLEAFYGENGYLPPDGSSEYEEFKRKYVPPYAADKFPNKWQKLDPDQPSHTITAHLGKDTYSHIHYDSEQARVISVREAARLQSFPDSFRFPRAMSHAYRQIGNAVPPLLAFTLAKHIKTAFSGERQARFEVGNSAGGMSRSNALALVVAYYFSRFDRVAYRNLGFATITEAHDHVGERLGVNRNTVKNMRDEFDSIHENSRVGWYQRDLRPSRQLVANSLEDKSEPELQSKVREILDQGTAGNFGSLESILIEVT